MTSPGLHRVARARPVGEGRDMATRYEPRGRLARAVHTFEETAIVVLLGVMTMLTFVNVVLRYLFNHSIIWFSKSS